MTREGSKEIKESDKPPKILTQVPETFVRGSTEQRNPRRLQRYLLRVAGMECRDNG